MGPILAIFNDIENLGNNGNGRGIDPAGTQPEKIVPRHASHDRGHDLKFKYAMKLIGKA